MKVLITGGTGFVGAWTAKAVQDGGHQVKFLVRNPDRLHTSAAQIGVDVGDHVVGDIADPDSTAAALEGCDAVIHCAAMVSTDPARAEEMLRTNLEGARNVLGGAAPRHTAHLEGCLHALGCLTELITRRWSQHHAGITDVHWCAGVLKTSRIRFDDGLGLAVPVGPADHGQVRMQHR